MPAPEAGLLCPWANQLLGAAVSVIQWFHFAPRLLVSIEIPAVRVRPFHPGHGAIQRQRLGRVVLRRERMMRLYRLDGAERPSDEQTEKDVRLHSDASTYRSPMRVSEPEPMPVLPMPLPTQPPR